MGFCPSICHDVPSYSGGIFFQVTTKLKAHSGHQPIGIISLTTRTEPFKERRTEDGDGNGLVDGGGDGPAPFAGIRYSTLEVGQVRTREERVGSEIQQPRPNDAATTPQLCHIGEVEIILVVLRVAERRGLSIDGSLLFADVSMMQDIEALCVGSHDAVLNTIVDHLDEVTSATRSTAQIPLLGSSPHLCSSRGTRRCVDARGQGGEDRVEMLDHILFPANHQTIAALEAPHAAAGSAVHIVDPFRFEVGRTAKIIVVVRIATVYDDVTGSKVWDNGLQRCIHRGSRHHQPDSARRGKLVDEVRQSGGTFCDGSSFEESLHGFRVTDVANDGMTCP